MVVVTMSMVVEAKVALVAEVKAMMNGGDEQMDL